MAHRSRNTVTWDTGAAYFGLPTAVFNAVAAVLELPENVTSTQDPYEVDCKHSDIIYTVLEVGFPGNGTVKIPVGRLVTKLNSGKCVTYALNGSGGSGETDTATNFGTPFLRSAYATYNLDTLELSCSQVKYTEEEQIVAIPAAG